MGAEDFLVLLHEDLGDILDNAALKSFNVDFNDLLLFVLVDDLQDFGGNRSFFLVDKGHLLSFSVVVKDNLVDNTLVNGDNFVLSAGSHNGGFDATDGFSLDDWHHFFSNGHNTGVLLGLLDGLNSVGEDLLVSVLVD